jgi:hypothetical protein
VSRPDDAEAQETAAALVPPLLAAARTAGTEADGITAQRALWAAVFALPRWLFVARGAEEEPRPFIGVPDEIPTIFAFTTGARARAFALDRLGLPEEEAGLMLAIPTASAVEWVAGFAEHGVQRIMFDDEFFAPIGNLLPIREDLARG